MSRVYATTPDGERFLVYLECDSCDARLRPSPDVSDSGWLKTGMIGVKDRGQDEQHWCPEHHPRMR